MVATREELLEQLQYASPLDSTAILQKMELYDKQSSQEIIDEVHAQFETGENIKDEIMKPVFLSVVDGFLESTEMGKQARRKGLTASRVIQECEAFRYDGENEISDINGYVEWKNAADYREEYGKENRDKFERAKYHNQNAMDKYKANAEKNSSGKLIQDEYDPEKKLYTRKNNPDLRRNDEKFDYLAETDHIIPLKEIHNRYKGNYGLSDDDIKRIANNDYNFALTSGELNGLKSKMTNSEFIKEQERLKREGQPYYKLSDDAKKIMLELEKSAQKEIEKDVNSTIKNNLTGQGIADRDVRKAAYDEEEQRLGRKLTKEDREKINKKLSREKTKDLYGELGKNAAEQSKEYAIGNVILFIVKPVYYELADCLKNGIKEGVGASSIGEAFGIRFGRVKDYVLANSAAFLGDSAWEFVKGFISSLIEGIIGLFVGIFKQVLKIVKEGIKIFTKSMDVLFGENSATMTSAEKGNAIVNILGSGIIAIAGIGLEALLNKLGIGEPWSIVFSTLLSGIAATLFMYLLNKADLFSTKAEQRKARIEEIFNERIKEINMAAETYNIVAVDVLKQQRESFENVVSIINDGFAGDNIEKINQGLYQMADFMKIELPYRDTDGFIIYMDSLEALSL